MLVQELLKWLQGVAGGLALQGLMYFQNMPVDGVWWQVVLTAVFVRLAGLIVAKFPLGTDGDARG